MRTTRASIAIAALALAACASTPPSRFYTLSSPEALRASTGGASVAVGPVAIPAMVDRPEIVVRIDANEVWLDEFNRWASPLADAIAGAAAANLGAGLDTARVTANAQSASVDADYRVSIDVQRFESAPGAYALLDALFVVRRNADGKTQAGRTVAREVPTDKSYDALADAHSRAVGHLATEIAQAIRALAAQPAQRAPSSR